jgi:glyoxylase-like metal-dependent hydrolase (beta-lactamase superfamily II)
VHPDELKFASADAATYFAAYKKYAAGSRSWSPPILDRWILLPMMRLVPRKRRESILERQSLRARARALDVEGPVPSLPEWQAIPTPGHTPGHVAFFRGSDRLLIAGDAVVTVELNSLRELVLWTSGRAVQKLAAPPRYFTWSRRVTVESLRLLAELQPAIIAPGHGPVIAGTDLADRLRTLASGLR